MQQYRSLLKNSWQRHRFLALSTTLDGHMIHDFIDRRVLILCSVRAGLPEPSMPFEESE